MVGERREEDAVGGGTGQGDDEQDTWITVVDNQG